VDAALEEVVDLEAQVVVLHPGGDARVVVEGEGLARLPGAVEDAEVDVRAGRRGAGLGGVPGQQRRKAGPVALLYLDVR
jgi:hypothetical protein